MIQVNIWAVLVAAVSSMIVGSIWYGPLFGKRFMKEMGMDQWSPEKQQKMQKSMGLSYFWQFIASIVMFYVFAVFVSAFSYVNLYGIKGALHVALLAWIGVVVPIQFGNSLWGGKRAIFWLSIGNSLVTLLVGALIIGAWRL